MPAEARARAGVLGHPISHSLSPVLHRAALGSLGLTVDYQAYDVEVPALAEFLAGLDAGWRGLSVTMPLKREALRLATWADPVALVTGAANTLILPDGAAGEPGALKAYNTDVDGIVRALLEGAAGNAADVGPGQGRRAEVVGGGATAASSVAALADLGWREARLWVRDAERALPVVETGAALGVAVEVLPLADWLTSEPAGEVVVATLPPGAADPVAATVGPATVADGAVLLDVAYAQRPTVLGAAWQAAGGRYVSGETMLLHQAVRQVELYAGVRPDVEVMRAAQLAALDA